jgi:hypothetical protein
MNDSGIPLEQPRVALYHPAPLWLPDNRIKTLLLFFDKVALLALDEKHDAASTIETAAVFDLLERDLLQILNPQMLHSQAVNDTLLVALRDEAVWQALDPIGRDKHFYYGRRVFSTLNGPEPSLEMMAMRNELLRQLGAGTDYRENADSPLIPTYRGEHQAPTTAIHIRLWAPILSVLAQILRQSALGRLDLHPVTDQIDTVRALHALLQLPGTPSREQIARFELENVAVDLSSVPLDEILSFRNAHGEGFRDYAQRLFLLVNELAAGDPAERAERLVDAREDLGRAADELRAIARGAWRSPLPTFALGILGAAWTAEQAASAPLSNLSAVLHSPSPATDLVRVSHTYVFHSASIL